MARAFFGLIVAAVASIGLAGVTTARADPFSAGVVRTPISAEPEFDALVWYPTSQPGEPWQIGPFPMMAAHDAPIADGRFPVVLLSHGGGRTGGSPLLLRGLPAHLARNGFVVVAPFHGKNRFPQRPGQIVTALDAIAADPRFEAHMAPDRLGMVGYSLGGAVTLALAGGEPDFARLATYCEANVRDRMSCGGGPQPGSSASEAPPPPAGALRLPDLPLKALILLDPFSVLFSPASLGAIDVPVLLVRPEASPLGDANVTTLVDELGAEPEVHTVPGGHFVIADVCPDALVAEAPDVCKDAPGVDRAAIHDEMDQAILTFLSSTL